MLNSPIIGVAIGIMFLFGALATLATAITEAIAWRLGLRAKFLIRGLLSLVDGSPSADGTQLKKLLGTAVLKNQGTQASLGVTFLEEKAKPSHAALRSWPSYIPGRSFAAGVLELIHEKVRALQPAESVASTAPGASSGSAPDNPAEDQSGDDAASSSKVTMASIEKAISALAKESGDSVFYQQLNALAMSAMGEVARFQKSVETWYDDHMDRVTGWYKDYIRWITAAVGLVAVLVLNIHLFAFADSLYTSEALGKTVVAKAVNAQDCQNKTPEQCLTVARDQVKSLEPALNVGWTVVPECSPLALKALPATDQPASCSWLQKYGITNGPGGSGGWGDFWAVVTLLAGYLLTVVALIPGARFWYDLLNRFGSFRSSGPKPASSTATS